MSYTKEVTTKYSLRLYEYLRSYLYMNAKIKRTPIYQHEWDFEKLSKILNLSLNSSYKTDYDIPVNFNFKNIEETTLLDLDTSCECFTFQFLLPFFWNLINNKNINTLFNKYLNSRIFYNGFYSSRKYEVELDWNNLELIKEQKIFLNILKINYYQRNPYLYCDCLENGKNRLTYQNIKEIIKLTIFDYSWNNHLNINNPEVKCEEIQVN